MPGEADDDRMRWASRMPRKTTLNPALIRAFRKLDAFTLDLEAMHDHLFAHAYDKEDA
jgi:hypothetical protein